MAHTGIKSIYISSANECTPDTFKNDTKLSGAVDSFKGRDTAKMKLDRLEQKAHLILIRFNKVKQTPALDSGQSPKSV